MSTSSASSSTTPAYPAGPTSVAAGVPLTTGVSIKGNFLYVPAKDGRPEQYFAVSVTNPDGTRSAVEGVNALEILEMGKAILDQMPDLGEKVFKEIHATFVEGTPNTARVTRTFTDHASKLANDTTEIKIEASRFQQAYDRVLTIIRESNAPPPANLRNLAVDDDTDETDFEQDSYRELADGAQERSDDAERSTSTPPEPTRRPAATSNPVARDTRPISQTYVIGGKRCTETVKELRPKTDLERSEYNRLTPKQVKEQEVRRSALGQALEVAQAALKRLEAARSEEDLKHVSSTSIPTKLNEEIAYYKQKIASIKAKLADGITWLSSNYWRDTIKELKSFTEAADKYISAPINMRFQSLEGPNGEYVGLTRIGVISDMRNGWYSSRALREASSKEGMDRLLGDTSKTMLKSLLGIGLWKKKAVKVLQGIGAVIGFPVAIVVSVVAPILSLVAGLALRLTPGERATKWRKEILSKHHVVDLGKVFGLGIGASLAIGPVVLYKLAKKVGSLIYKFGVWVTSKSIEKRLKVTLSELESSVNIEDQTTLKRYLDKLNALKDKKAPERLKEGLEIIGDLRKFVGDLRDTPELQAQLESELSQFEDKLELEAAKFEEKLQLDAAKARLKKSEAILETNKKAMKALLKEMEANPGPQHAEELKKLVDDQLGILGPQVSKEYLKYKLQLESIKFGLDRLLAAAADPAKLRSLIEERRRVCGDQMLQLLDFQMRRNPHALREGVFRMIHVGLLNGHSQTLDSTGWMHDEGVEMSDMNEIFKEFDGKKIKFSEPPDAPRIDWENGEIYLPTSAKPPGISEEDAKRGITLKAYFFDISVQGNTANDDIQKKINDENMERLRRDDDLNKTLPRLEDIQEDLAAITPDKKTEEVEEEHKKKASGTSQYRMASDFIFDLLAGRSTGPGTGFVKPPVAVSAGCLSVKDRTGVVVGHVMQRLASLFSGTREEDNPHFATIMNPDMPAARIVEKNTGIRSLKVHPLANHHIGLGFAGRAMGAVRMAWDSVFGDSAA